MPERPLFLFPTPETASRSTLGGGGGRFHFPTHHRQGERLEPKFDQLQEAVRSRNIEIQQAVTGIDPEQVLVLETIGSVKDFANAVKKIPGFEWMGEFEVDEIAPDEDFYDEKHREKELNGRLFLVLTNQRALDEMLSLWRRYRKDPAMQFEHGFAKFRDVFLRLKDIRRWDVQDRLLETENKGGATLFAVFCQCRLRPPRIWIKVPSSGVQRPCAKIPRFSGVPRSTDCFSSFPWRSSGTGLHPWISLMS